MSILRLFVLSPEVEDEFTENICRYFDVKHCFLVSSGSASLAIILRALSRLAGPEKNEVVVPAYTCFSVPSAIARVGLYIRPCDIDETSLDFDYEELARLDMSRVLCVIPSNLFGFVSDWRRLLPIRKRNGLFFIDDAAQSMGAMLNGQYSGTFGDVGFFSLGRGKNITAMSGGIIVTDSDELALVIGEQVKEVRPTKGLGELAIMAKFFIYCCLLRPQLYWLPLVLPFLKLGETKFDLSFDIQGLSRLQHCVGSVLMKSLKRLNLIRTENATTLLQALSECHYLRPPKPTPGSSPVYLRLPLVAETRAMRNRIVASMRRAGMGASEMYPNSIDRIAGVERFLSCPGRRYPKAERVAACLLTLPTHPYVSSGDIRRMTRILQEEGREG